MRTTLTLDPDVSSRLAAEVGRTDQAFKVVVNDALRRGLKIPSSSERREPYAVKPLRLVFRAGIDSDKLNALAGELEVEAVRRKLRV